MFEIDVVVFVIACLMFVMYLDKRRENRRLENGRMKREFAFRRM